MWEKLLKADFMYEDVKKLYKMIKRKVTSK